MTTLAETRQDSIAEENSISSFLEAYRQGQREFPNADLSRAQLAGKNLKGVNLSYADLSGCDLTNTNLRGADLSFAVLREANLTNTCLKGAILIGSNFTDATLDGADLENADYDATQTIFPPGFVAP